MQSDWRRCCVAAAGGSAYFGAKSPKLAAGEQKRNKASQ
jgi:hypothetical protein